MPVYDYRCLDCGHQWEEFHEMDDMPRDCPDCEGVKLQRRITTAPTIAGGVMTHAGDGRRATKEQLQEKWAEETPKLRKKLVAKYGDKALDSMPTLKHNYDND